MTEAKMIEALAKVISAATLGKTATRGGMDAAAAVLELMRPKRLVWQRNGNHWAGGRGYVARKMGSRYTLTMRNQFDQQFDTLEAAQAAAQAHADADWIASLPLADMIGGE